MSSSASTSNASNQFFPTTKIDIAFLKLLFPDRDDSKIQGWHATLEREEVLTLADASSLTDKDWESLSFPLAVRRSLAAAASQTVQQQQGSDSQSVSSWVSATVDIDNNDQKQQNQQQQDPIPDNKTIEEQNKLKNQDDDNNNGDGDAEKQKQQKQQENAQEDEEEVSKLSQLDVVLIDISHSMKSKSKIDVLKTREDLSKLVFHVMVDRILSLELGNAVGLIAFGQKIHATRQITTQFERCPRR